MTTVRPGSGISRLRWDLACHTPSSEDKGLCWHGGCTVQGMRTAIPALPITGFRGCAAIGLVVLLGVQGCLTTKGAQPDDMSAAEHEKVSERLDQDAVAHDQKYNPKLSYVDADNSGIVLGESVGPYNPTERHQTEASKLRRHAAAHRAAAHQLYSFEERECRAFQPETRRLCPLIGTINKVEYIDDGVRIELKDEVLLEAAVKHMRCHVAVGRTQGRKGMPQCPLYLKGLTISATGDGRSVTLTTDTDNLQSLRVRIADHATR